MSRDLRPHAINTIYHVTARGNNRDNLFLSDKDREAYLRLWRKYSQELECDVYAYVLMTNHVHWLVRYARIFNQANERVGHVFQGRFGSQVCLDDKYILSLCRYIHRNPLKAGLVENLSEYPWSSYPDLCGKRNDTLVNRGFWSDYFHGSTSNELRELVEGGSDEYDSELQLQTKQSLSRCKILDKKEKRPSLDELAGVMAVELQTTTEELQGTSRLQNCVLARKQLIIEAVRNHAYKRSEVARYLKMDRAFVTRVLQKPF
jgi:REP element-mobilizing transposase RayT